MYVIHRDIFWIYLLKNRTSTYIYLVNAKPLMLFFSFFLGNSYYHNSSIQPLDLCRVWSLWRNTKVHSCQLAALMLAMTLRPVAWILLNSPPVPGPLPHQQSSPRLAVCFMQHPACQPLNVTLVPSPCASLSLSGIKWKPDASFFLLLPSFKPGIWSTGCRMEPLFMEPLISLPACHTIAPAGLVTTQTWELRKQSRQIQAPFAHNTGNEMMQKKSIWL